MKYLEKYIVHSRNALHQIMKCLHLEIWFFKEYLL
jgi:hypothetical protein